LKKEEVYTLEALKQAETFLARSEAAYQKNPKDQTVIQFARTSAQSAENARALAMGAVGGLLVRRLEAELAQAKAELTGLKGTEPVATVPSAAVATIAAPALVREAPPAAPPLVKQPALWFAVAGWAVAVVLLFRRRSI
jgi:hypothetical protein